MRNRISSSKIRCAVAGVTAVVLSIISISAIWGDGMQTGKLALALALSIGVGALIALDTEFGERISIVIFLLLPFGALCAMEFYTHVPWDLTVPIFVLNYVFYLLLYGIWTAVFGGSRIGCVAGAVIPMIAGLANYFVVAFRSSPVVPWDIFSIGTAASITDNYSFTLSFRVVFVLIGFAYLMAIGEKTRICFRKWKVRLGAAALSVMLVAGYVTAIQVKEVEDAFGMDDILFTPNVLYRNNGFMAAFLANLQYLNVEKPQGYSAEAAQELRGMYLSQAKEDTEREVSKDAPNIFVIMNEAFSDLSVYGSFGVSEDPLAYWNSLKENTVRGKLFVSVKGGNTANTEFEFLTGNSMAFMPTGSIPYQQFLKSETPSLASHLKSLGYQTVGLHPYYASGWNRKQVYPDLGFERSMFREDFSDASVLRGYVDDASAFRKLIDLYEEKPKGQPIFAFEVTMQNHGGYSKEYADLEPEVLLTDFAEDEKNIQIRSTEKYLTLMKKTDQAFGELLEYFENQEEKTLVVMFGDHQPSDYICNPILDSLGIPRESRETSLDEFAKGYEVPFVIWANYDIEEDETQELSANYLSTLLMDTAGLPLTEYQSYLQQLREDFPIVTANFFKNGKENTFHKPSESGADETDRNSLNSYAIFQYNNMVDKKNRLDGFF